jgi:RNA polymerase sigma-70 factor (family 1)
MINQEAIDEKGLLKRLAEGDEVAFTVIYNHYWRRLMALAYSHTKDKFLAEELVQEIFLAMWKKREVVEIRSLTAYLATAVKFSVFINISRRNRKQQIIDGLAKYSGEAYNNCYHAPDELLDAKFLEEYINNIVEELPEKCKLVYLSSRKHHMSTAEIADDMNIAVKTVEAHLTKALKLLRYNLKDLLILIWIFKSH